MSIVILRDDIENQIVKAALEENFDKLDNLIKGLPQNQPINEKGYTILMVLIENQCIDACMWFYSKYKPDLTIKNIYGENLLHVAIKNKLPAIVSLLTNNDKVFEIDDKGRNYVIHAVLHRDITSLQILLDHDQSVDSPDKYGMTAIAYAIYFQSLEMLDKLLDINASYLLNFTILEIPPELKGGVTIEKLPYQTTYLHLAIMTGNMSIFIRVIKMFESLTVLDSNSKTPLELAADLCLPDFVYILSSLGSPNPLFEAIITDNYDAFSKLLDKYSNSIDNKGRTPLHYAVMHNRPKMISILSARYSLLPDFEGKLPYHYSENNYFQQIKNFVGSPSIFGSFPYADAESLYSMRFQFFANGIYKSLKNTYHLIKDFVKTSNPQYTITHVGNLIVQYQHQIQTEVKKLFISYESSNLESVIAKIFKSNEFETLLKNINSDIQSQMPKLHDNDAITLSLGYSAVLSWVRALYTLFTISSVTFGNPLSTNTQLLQRYLTHQNIIDDAFTQSISKGQPESVLVRKPYIKYNVVVTDAKPYDKPQSQWDSFVKEKLAQLFNATTENNLMFPPTSKFISSGNNIIILCEAQIIFIVQNSSSVRIPLFGCYLRHVNDSSHEILLVFHSGSCKLKFEDHKSMKSFIEIFNALCQKYFTPESFFNKEESRPRPLNIVFSYINKKSTLPSLTLTVEKISKNLQIYEKYRAFEKTLGPVVTGSLRCHPFQFPKANCSPSFYENA